MFEKYLKIKATHPHCYRNLDIKEPTVFDLMSKGYLFPLEEKDPEGRVVLFGRSAMFSQKSGHKPSDLFRSIIMSYETLLEDPEVQKKGFVYIFDQEGVQLSEVTYLGLWEMQRLLKSGEVSKLSQLIMINNAIN